MAAIDEILRHDLAKPDLSEGYAEAFEDAYIATQIKVLREQNQWTQAQLANELKTTQTVVSRIENVNYSAWNIRTLKKLARAFRLRLHVSFETYGSLIDEMGRFSRTNLERAPREKDSVLNGNEAQIDTQTDKRAVAKTGGTLQQLVGKTGLGVPLSDAFLQAVNHPMLPPQYLRGGNMTLQNLAGLGLPTSAPTMLPVETTAPVAPKFRHSRGRSKLEIVWRNKRENGNASNPSPQAKPVATDYFFPKQKFQKFG